MSQTLTPASSSPCPGQTHFMPREESQCVCVFVLLLSVSVYVAKVHIIERQRLTSPVIKQPKCPLLS